MLSHERDARKHYYPDGKLLTYKIEDAEISRAFIPDDDDFRARPVQRINDSLAEGYRGHGIRLLV